ncbi:MAG: hypothetical protein LC749_15730 [Actinobacteria bacterium]|nr:hypothetical protein [Actinomycetota bacterium]
MREFRDCSLDALTRLNAPITVLAVVDTGRHGRAHRPKHLESTTAPSMRDALDSDFS